MGNVFDLFGGGDSPRAQEEKKAKRIAYQNSQWSSLLTNVNKKDPVTGNYLLDNQTMSELTGLLTGGFNSINYGKASSLYAAATEGISPKFKARQGTQALHNTLLDQPGASQTRMGSLLDAYKGKIK